VFEFKFVFEFICLLLYKNEQNHFFLSSLSLLSLSDLLLFWPKVVEVQRRPSYFSPATAANPLGPTLARLHKPASQQPSRPA
jgi:hypothetical protein